MEKFKLISPTWGKQYTVGDVLNKLLERRNFEYSMDTVPYPVVYSYGYDYDGHIHLEAFSVPSAWTESVDCKLVADIPFHYSNAGKYTFGSWNSYADFPEDRETGYRQNKLPVIVTAILGNEEDTIEFTWDFTAYNSEDPDLQNIQKLLLDILKSAIIQHTMFNWCMEARKRLEEE